MISVNIGKILILILLAAVIALACFFLPFRAWFTDVEAYVRSFGAIAPVFVTLTYIISTVLFIPGSAMTLATVTIFGPETGFLIVFAGANLGALCSFLLARTFLREKVLRWAETNQKFRSLDRAIADQGFKMTLLARLSPAFPFNMLNYLLGVSGVTTVAYVLATLIGMLPGMILYVYIGAAARDAFTGVNGAFDLIQQLAKYLGLIATVALVFILTQIARNALPKNEQKSVGPLSSLPRDGGDGRGGV